MVIYGNVEKEFDIHGDYVICKGLGWFILVSFLEVFDLLRPSSFPYMFAHTHTLTSLPLCVLQLAYS